MSTHRDGRSADELGDHDSEGGSSGVTPRRPNRTHVTLANLADLNLAAFANKTATEEPDATGGDEATRTRSQPDVDESWLSKLPTPVEEAPDDDGAGGGAGGTSTDLVTIPPGGPPSPVIAPDAVAKPLVATPVVVPGRARLTGAYGTTTGEHRAWVVPSARQREIEAGVEVAADADAATASVRTGFARWLERWLLEVMALAVAAIAFVTPVAWLAFVAAVTLVGAAVAFVVSGRPLVMLPVRAGRRALTLLRPRSLVWVPVFAARTVLGAVVLPAAVTATTWYIAHGTPGTVAAARAGAWAYGLRVGAVLLCLLLLTSVGDGRQQRAAAARRWATPATDGTLGILAASCVLVVLLAVVGAPHPGDSVARRADGLGWLPPGTRATVDRVRDDVVTAELDSLASCLSKRGGTVWQPFYTVENPLDEPDVARLVAAREPAFSPPSDLVTVLLAAHNQLAPWVEAIEVEWPGGELVRTERATLPSHEPLVDTDLLVPATSSGAQWVSSGTPDTAITLHCSVASLL